MYNNHIKTWIEKNRRRLHMYLRRKIDDYLTQWKNNENQKTLFWAQNTKNRKPLIISILRFKKPKVRFLATSRKIGGERGIRTPGTVLPVRRFSKPFLSATQASLHMVVCLMIDKVNDYNTFFSDFKSKSWEVMQKSRLFSPIRTGISFCPNKNGAVWHVCRYPAPGWSPSPLQYIWLQWREVPGYDVLWSPPLP